MHFMKVNLLAVLVSAIATMVVGFLWYSPVLFAKPWMREMGYDPNDKARTQEMRRAQARLTLARLSPAWSQRSSWPR